MNVAPALMLSWEFWRRHRFGLAGVFAVVAGFAAACAISPFAPNIALANSIWLGFGICYVIGVFAHGFEGKLETPESGYPTRFFVLPVRSILLVGGPMIQGIALTVLLGLAWDHFVLRPSAVEMPAWSTAALAAVVAVSQALVWLPFGLPWLRILVGIVALVALLRAPLILAIVGVGFDEPEHQDRFLIRIDIILVAASFLVAWLGVSRARHGGNADWLQSLQFRSRAAVSEPQAPFSSAMRAQIWYEWRSRGRGYVIASGCVLFALFALAVVLHAQVGWHITDNFVLLIVPFLVASFMSPFTGSSSVDLRKPELTAFAATRPMNDTDTVAAKHWALGLATLMTWALVWFVVLGWFACTGDHEQLQRLWERNAAQLGAEKLTVAVILNVLGAVLLTWRMLTVSLWTGLSGRPWLVALQLMFFMSLSFQVLYEMALWNDEQRRARMLTIITWLGILLVAVKFLTATWALRRIQNQGELTGQEIARLLAMWFVFVGALSGVLIWLIPSSNAAPHGIVLWVLALTPLARPALAPMCLAWNRHR